MPSNEDLPNYPHITVTGPLTDKSAAAIFDKICNGAAPNIIGCGNIGKYSWELSYGYDLHGNLLYGITVVDGWSVKPSMSRVVSSTQDALEYIKHLEKKYANN